MSYSLIYKKINISKNLIYPLLGITPNRNSSLFFPKKTFLWWEGVVNIEFGEILVYFKEFSPSFVSFEEKYLLPAFPLARWVFPDNNYIYIFDTLPYMNDITHILEGKYSKISEESKQKIRNFWGDSDFTVAQMPLKGHDFKIILYPQYYFSSASEELNVPLQYISKNGELLYKINKEEETFDTSKLIIIQNEIQL